MILGDAQLVLLFWPDYLVDDDHGCSSISDFLSERNREQSLVDLLIPSLDLLISVLQRLQVCCFKLVFSFYCA